MLVVNNIFLLFIGFFLFIVVLMNKFVIDLNYFDFDIRVVVWCGVVIICIVSIV